MPGWLDRSTPEIRRIGVNLAIPVPAIKPIQLKKGFRLMSSSNTLDDSKPSNSPESSTTEDGTNLEPAQANDNAETKDEMALALPNGPDKSLSVKFRTSDLPGSRPVTVSQHPVAETFRAVGGNRPIFASSLAVSGMIHASGDRPISASTLVISENYSLMGGKRPIAANTIDDEPSILMGYLD